MSSEIIKRGARGISKEAFKRLVSNWGSLKGFSNGEPQKGGLKRGSQIGGVTRGLQIEGLQRDPKRGILVGILKNYDIY